MAKHAKYMAIAKQTPKVYWGNSPTASSTEYIETLNIEQPAGYTLKDVKFDDKGTLTVSFEPDKFYITADKWSNWISGKDYSDLASTTHYESHKATLALLAKADRLKQMQRFNRDLDTNHFTMNPLISLKSYTLGVDHSADWKMEWK